MTGRTKRVLGLAGGTAAVAVGAFFLLGNRSLSDIPGLDKIASPPKCPLTGERPRDEGVVDRPAVAVKIENNPVAYPLSGLEEADVVYEELVEGGLTRFLAIYHCRSTDTAGPIRSARAIDPAIVLPYTRILGNAGGNPAVRRELEDAEIVSIDEMSAGEAMRRIDRPGIGMEHTLYADIDALRKLGKKRFSDPPRDDLLKLGELEGKARRARSITISFSPSSVARYEWSDGRYLRYQGDSPLLDGDGNQIAVDNVLIEEHTVNLSNTVGDVLGAASTEIADVTGSGRAVLFRDGRAIVGRWTRDAVEEPVRFLTKSGDAMVLHPGTTWVALVPDDEGEVSGSFSFHR